MSSLTIMEPHIEQAAAFARLLRENSPNIEINGWLEQERPFFLNRGYFHRIDIASFADKQHFFDNRLLPTGISSTLQLLESRGFVDVGEIRMEKESLRVCDKVFLLQLARECGIAVPNMFKHTAAVNQFPVFVKDAREDDRRERLRAIIYGRDKLKEIDQKAALIQEYIDSPRTYGVGFLARNGQMVEQFTHVETVSIPRQGGAAVFIEQFDDSRLQSYTEKLLKALDYSGWGLAEFKFCPRRNDYVLMEINAKWWASVEFALRNNPGFFQQLFDIKIKAENISRAVFLGRYMMMPLSRQIRYLPDLFGCYRIDRDQLGHLLASRYVPGRLKGILRKLAA